MMVPVLAVVFVLCLSLVIWRPPAGVIEALAKHWPQVLWQADVKEQVVALTIDDGPSEFTEEILGVLKANGATATFFVIGSHIPGRDRMLQQLLQDGHELGNHGMYDEPAWRLSDDALFSQIRTVDQQIGTIYDSIEKPHPSKLFRPGSGFFSSRMLKVVATLGYRLILGGIYPHDAQIGLWRLNAWHIRSLIRPGGIIICHDGRPWTTPMLRRVLPDLKRKNYRIVSVSSLLQSQCT
ncbi:uncharacterized protein HMPREF1541_08551 [Cyphellophora europaea CBS 101466]|uniref:chitin deacetylase n=1 Tax=Cyphellophora europaea (strain CBS 101466) TaxID=1220924 RepID=W2RKL6_CYPE1|nr:uncharacterized protein HMPREF1541_08551 [Cyphellophora europaea CBS 101466]ETN36274.1 hypothetical protein HMPREF1541_08551 [Cyphellophora europaea CBS 101466]